MKSQNDTNNGEEDNLMTSNTISETSVIENSTYNNKRKKWTNKEMKLLTGFYEKGIPVELISIELNRSLRSVYGKACGLGLIHKTFREQDYSIKENNFLIENAQYETCETISKLLGRSLGSVQQRGKRLGIKFNHPRKHAQYQKNHSFFDEPRLMNCYIAGLLASDGWIRPKSSDKAINQVGISLARKDIHVIEHIKEKTGYTGPIRKYEVDGHPQAELRINGVPQWISSLEKNWGIKKNKSLTLDGPPISLQHDYLLAYLSGLIEGDGSVRFNNGTLELSYTSGSKQFADWMRNTWVDLTGAQPWFSEESKNRKNPAYYIKFYGGNARNLCGQLMKSNITMMNRKWDNARLEITKHQRS